MNKITLISLIVILISLSSYSFAANTIITNMTPSTISGGYIGNATHNYTFKGLYYGTWLGNSITGLEPLWNGNSSLVLGWNKTYADTLYYGISNPYMFWNNTWAGFNKTYADTLYVVLGTKTGNTTSEIQAAINSSNKEYNISINSTNILNVPNSWTTTFNSSYITSETEPLWNGNYSLVALLSNQGNWNVNRSNYWDNLDSPLSTWIETFNQTYHTMWINNYSAKTDYVNNATERTLFLNTFNSSYMTNTFNTTYHNWWTSNYSAKTDYVNNATERSLFTTTYNTSYDSQLGHNTSTEIRTALNNSGFYNLSINASNVLNPTWISSYAETDPRWQGNSSLVLNNITNLLSSNTTTNTRIDNLNTSKANINGNVTFYSLNATIAKIPHQSGIDLNNVIVSNGDGTVNISNNTGAFYIGGGFETPISHLNITGGRTGTELTALSNGVTNYIVANYNSGTPKFDVLTDESLIDYINYVPYAEIYRSGNNIHIQTAPMYDGGESERHHNRVALTDRYARQSGLDSITVSSDLNISVNGGTVWSVNTPYSLTASNYTTTWFFNYHNGTSWNISVGTSPKINNTHWDNGTALVPLIGTNYTINYIYRGVENQDHIYTVLDNQHETLELAKASATLASLPELVTSHAILIGRVIVQNGATNYTIESAFTERFTGASSVNSHNGLSGIQGGIAGEYYHLTLAYLNSLIANISAQTEYVRNATERTLFTNTFNTSYDSKINITPLACGGTDKFSAVSASGVFTCTTDQLGGAGSSFNQTYHDNWQANYSAKTDYLNNATDRTLLSNETLWKGNASTVLNWNKSYADTLYYAITNPYSFYNSTTIPAYSLITNLVGYLGNWSADKSSYTATSGLVAILGNWSADKSSYATTISLTSVGNWTNDRSVYINTTRSWTNDTNINITGTTISWAGTLADGRIASATTWSNKAGTGACSANQFATATATGGVTCSQPSGANITSGTITTTQLMAGTLAWGNISGYNLNSAWTNTLGGGNITDNTITSAKLVTGTLAWNNISSRALNIAWTGTLGGGNITDNTITTSELVSGTLNQANLTNTVATCSNQFSRGMGATTQNCATVGNGDMTSGDYAAITGIGTQGENLNMNNYNVSTVQCLTFQSGGKICSG